MIGRELYLKIIIEIWKMIKDKLLYVKNIFKNLKIYFIFFK